jgi:hypothetical protein
MSYKNLQDYIYYSELYDRMTIDECECWDSEVYDAHAKSGEKFDPEKPSRRLHGGLLADLHLYFVKGERYLDKETTINEWMKRDQEKDEKLENAIEPKGVRCLHCSRSLTNCTSRDLMTDSKGKEEVVFMFECDKCHKRRAYWENGVEWRPKPVLCEKCRSEMESNHVKKDDIIETTYYCPQCHHKTVDSMDFSTKEEVIDPGFESKRKKYCLSKEEGIEYSFGKQHLEAATNLMKKVEEREENSDLYDAIAKIKKLTVAELQSFLDPVIEKAGYAKLEFEKPDIQRDVILGFGIQDVKSGRNDRESIYDLQRLLKTTLKLTNWRLMSDGVNYRLGYLQGRLKGVEGEDNLRKLVEKDLKK